ncbi:DUF2946 domain-containing protein [Herminiimonas aquatilis]|uniref:DUF2946 domain-containing protein n=1 Tax=Herminiimonas aquatilis TaxID=345342 RepID=A0ABW2J4W3_9BURK
MKSRTRQTVFIAWIALFTLLFGSLAPSVSHALKAKSTQDTSWAEICSADGMRSIHVENQSPDSSAPSEHGLHMEDCPFCLNHAGGLGLPPSGTYAMPVTANVSTQPSLFYQSPHPLFIWAAAQSRAPPHLL